MQQLKQVYRSASLRPSPTLILGLLAVLGFSACSDDQAADPICFPLETEACTCDDGRDGIALCNDEAIFDDCLCPEEQTQFAPTAISQTTVTDEDLRIELTLEAELNLREVEEGEEQEIPEITWEIASPPTHGTISDTLPLLTYTPDPDFNGRDSFAFRAWTYGLASNTATVEIIVRPANDPPTVEDLSFIIVEELGREIQLVGHDPDGDRVLMSIVDAPEHGELRGAAPTVVYVPDADYSGPDSFTYSGSDGQADSDPGTVSLDVQVTNDFPVAEAQTRLRVDEGGTVALDDTVFLQLADFETDALGQTIVVAPSWGTLVHADDGELARFDIVAEADIAAGKISYVHDSSETIEDAFFLRVEDLDGGFHTTRFDVAITPVNDDPSLTVNDGLTVEEGQTAEVNDNGLLAEDVDDNPAELVYTVTSGPSNGTLSAMTFTQAAVNSGAVTYTHDGGETTADAFTFTLSDGDETLEATEFTITVTPANDGPTFTSEPVIHATEDAVYTYNIATADVDAGDTRAIRVAGAIPPFTTFEDHGDGTATLTGTPRNSDVGWHRATLIVRDAAGAEASQSFVILVANTNDAPEFVSEPLLDAIEDDQYTYAIVTEDGDVEDTREVSVPEGDPLPDWLRLVNVDDEDGSARLIGTPLNEHVGDNDVVLEVTDNRGGSTTQEFTIVVQNTNDRPSVDSEAVTTADENSPYTYNVAASDPDVGDSVTLTYTAHRPGEEDTLGEETWFEFADNGNGAGVLSGTPIEGDEGPWQVAVRATDEDGAFTEQRFIVEVNNTNTAPVFVSTPETTVSQLEEFVYDIEIADPDEEEILGSTLVVTADFQAGDDWLSLELIEDEGGNFMRVSGSAPEGSVGDHLIELLVTDHIGLTDDQVFLLSVSENSAPFFTTEAEDEATEDSPYVYEIETSDLDGDDIEVSVSDAAPLPGWLALDADETDGTAVLYSTRDPGDDEVTIGEHLVALQVTDSNGAVGRQEFTLVVNNVNDVPAFTSEAVTSARENEFYQYDITTFDPDPNETLVITVESYAYAEPPPAIDIPIVIEPPRIDSWLSIEDRGDGTAVLSGTPRQGDELPWSVTLTVDDGESSAPQSFTIEVQNTNDPPYFDDGVSQEAAAGVEYDALIIVDDPDVEDVLGDNLTVALEQGPDFLNVELRGIAESAHYVLTGTPSEVDAGEHDVVLVVTDRFGLTDTLEVTLTVTVSEPVSIRATVWGWPLSGVEIVVEGDDDPYVMTTDMNGIADFGELDTGEYVVMLPHGFVPYDLELTIDEPIDLSIPLGFGAWPTREDAFEGEGGDDTPDQASGILLGEAQYRTIFPDGDVDFIAVDLEADMTYEVFTTYQSWTKSQVYNDVLRVVDFEGTEVHLQMHGGGPHNDSFSVEVSGTYFIEVSPFFAEFAEFDCGVWTYVLHFNMLSEADDDGYGPFHDCEPGDAAVNAFAQETSGPGDGNCDGWDPPTVDPGNDPLESVNAIPGPPVPEWRMIYDQPLSLAPYVDTFRWLTNGEEEWYTLTLDPEQVITLHAMYDDSLNAPQISVFNDVGDLLVSESYGAMVDNDSDVPLDVDVRVTPSSDGEGWVFLYFIDEGTNVDDDNYTSENFWYWDPDDNVSNDELFCDTQCFVAGTLVTTTSGLQPIEILQAGDMVLSRHEDGGKLNFQPIVRTMVFDDKPVIEVTTQGQGVSDALRVTRSHPFWVEGQGWTASGQLEVGDRLRSRDDAPLWVSEIRALPQRDTVYNFTVATDHTYFVGESETWVHNK